MVEVNGEVCRSGGTQMLAAPGPWAGKKCWSRYFRMLLCCSAKFSVLIGVNIQTDRTMKRGVPRQFSTSFRIGRYVPIS